MYFFECLEYAACGAVAARGLAIWAVHRDFIETIDVNTFI